MDTSDIKRRSSSYWIDNVKRIAKNIPSDSDSQIPGVILRENYVLWGVQTSDLHDFEAYVKTEDLIRYFRIAITRAIRNKAPERQIESISQIEREIESLDPVSKIIFLRADDFMNSDEDVRIYKGETGSFSHQLSTYFKVPLNPLEIKSIQQVWAKFLFREIKEVFEDLKLTIEINMDAAEDFGNLELSDKTPLANPQVHKGTFLTWAPKRHISGKEINNPVNKLAYFFVLLKQHGYISSSLDDITDFLYQSFPNLWSRRITICNLLTKLDGSKFDKEMGPKSINEIESVFATFHKSDQ